MAEKFKTILKEGQAEIIEKKSRFISYAKPVKTEEEARAFVEGIKKMNWDATHNVFAYQVGEKNEIQRFSDDGEPQGTAGMPVLTVLMGEEIKNTAVVVTRYFGGTLLGTGWLVRAYGKAAKEAVLDAGIAEINTFERFSVKCSYSLSGKVQYEILQGGYMLEDTIFTENVEYIVLTEFDKKDIFQSRITDITGAKAEICDVETVRGAFVDGKLEICE
jgi:uncharacterized YigZ family protein